MTEPLVLVVEHEGWVELRINRPEKRNALSQGLVTTFVEALDELERRALPVAVLSAIGPVFSAGADIKEWLPGRRPSDQLLDRLTTTGVFLVAKVAAPVYGAAVSVVTVCPVLVATPAVSFSLPEADQGVFPVPTPYLEVAVPRRRLVEVGLQSSPIGAEEAQRWGLVSSVVPEDRLDAEVATWIGWVHERPVVADQTRRYWQEQFTTPAFRARDEWMRQLGQRNQEP